STSYGAIREIPPAAGRVAGTLADTSASYVERVVMILPAVLLGLTLLGGLVLMRMRLRGANPPTILAILHGILAGAGWISLLVAILATGKLGTPFVALVILTIGALIGAFMAIQHAKRRLIPVYAVFVHGLTQFFGYCVLLAHLFG